MLCALVPLSTTSALSCDSLCNCLSLPFDLVPASLRSVLLRRSIIECREPLTTCSSSFILCFCWSSTSIGARKSSCCPFRMTSLAGYRMVAPTPVALTPVRRTSSMLLIDPSHRGSCSSCTTDTSSSAAHHHLLLTFTVMLCAPDPVSHSSAPTCDTLCNCLSLPSDLVPAGLRSALQRSSILECRKSLTACNLSLTSRVPLF